MKTWHIYSPKQKILHNLQQRSLYSFHKLTTDHTTTTYMYKCISEADPDISIYLRGLASFSMVNVVVLWYESWIYVVGPLKYTKALYMDHILIFLPLMHFYIECITYDLSVIIEWRTARCRIHVRETLSHYSLHLQNVKVIVHVKITWVTSIYHSYFIYNIFLERQFPGEYCLIESKQLEYKSSACIFFNIFKDILVYKLKKQKQKHLIWNKRY
jgi:hypothetical protein